jgi:myosin-5
VRTVHDAGDTSDEEDGSSSSDGGRGSLSRKLPHTISQDSMLCMTPKGASQPGSSNRSAFSMSTKDPAFAVSPMKSVFFKAYQLSTMERIRQVTPILEAFGNACIAHTQNSSRLGKYAELSFSKRGDLVGGEIRTYLLENVRVIRQLERERNFHIFYQIAAGASTEERNRWAVGEISSFHYANQGGKTAMRNPLVDDVAAFQSVRENFANLGFEEDAVENILQVVAGILHLGQIEFTFTTALEGQVAEVIEKFVSVGDKSETELSAAARLCSFSAEELNRCLTKRTVLLNKESFLKSLTPEQALSARDAVAKAIYKRLFTWLVQELNTKLRPTENMPAAITSSVGILDIFGFDSFAVNSFEQLCINYANEALQQHFSQHMFKLELLEYKREGIPFEDIEFPDNQESLDLITSGVFTILDDQCRIPNPTDKRFASQLYKDLATNEKFSASAPQMSANQFCVQHFAGPVVYATDTFTEKNLDQLPQDAAELLKNSRNPVLAGESATETVLPPVEVSDATAGLPKAPLPVMAAYVSKTKVDPASRLGKPGPSAAPARRGSLGGKGLPSVVAQLRNEVAVMMAHINTTVSCLFWSLYTPSSS